MVRLCPGSITITGPEPFGTALDFRDGRASGAALDVRCAEVGCADVGCADVGWLDRVVGTWVGEGTALLGVAGALALAWVVAATADDAAVPPEPAAHAARVSTAHAMLARDAPVLRARRCTRLR
jgi:hypothetical protein